MPILHTLYIYIQLCTSEARFSLLSARKSGLASSPDREVRPGFHGFAGLPADLPIAASVQDMLFQASSTMLAKITLPGAPERQYFRGLLMKIVLEFWSPASSALATIPEELATEMLQRK